MFRWIATILSRKASNTGEMASAQATPVYIYRIKLYYILLNVI